MNKIIIYALDSNLEKLFDEFPELATDGKVVAALIDFYPDNVPTKIFLSLTDDEDVMEARIYWNYNHMYYASDRLKSDRDFVVKILKKDNRAFKYISNELKNDPEVLLYIICNTNNFDKNLMPKSIISNVGFYLDILRHDIANWYLVPNTIITNDEFKTKLKSINLIAWCYVSYKKKLSGKEFNKLVQNSTLYMEPEELVKEFSEICMDKPNETHYVVKIPNNARVEIIVPDYIITDKFIVSKKC